MTKIEAAAALGISLRTLERRMHNGTVKFSRSGEGRFSEVSFSYADLGLPEPEIRPLASPQSPDLPADDAKVRTELATLPIGESDQDESTLPVAAVSDEELTRRIALGNRPDNPNGTPSNAPCIGSSTMPSMENFVRRNEALAEQEKRKFAKFTPAPRPSVTFHRYTGSMSCAAHNSLVQNLGRPLK